MKKGRASILLSRVHWKTLAFWVVPTLIADVVVYCSYYPRPAVVGLLGDMYNFVAGIWLARDLLFKEHELELSNLYTELKSDTAGRDLPLESDGVKLSEPNAVERIFNRRKAGDALSACLLLGLGLALVFVARLLELVEQGKVEMMWIKFK